MSSCRHSRIIYALSVQCIVYKYICMYLICSLQVLWSRTCGSCPSRWCRTSSTTTGSRPPSLCLLLRLRCAPLLNFMFKFTHVQSLFSLKYFFYLLRCSIQDQDKRLQALLNACEKLPPANNNNFKWVTVSMFLSSWSSCWILFIHI